MKRNRKRYGLVALLALVVATASFAYADANIVPDSNAGLGDGDVSGYTVSNIHWNLDATDPATIGTFTFDTSPSIPTGGDVRVSLDTGTGFTTWLDAGDCSVSGATVTCDPSVSVSTEALIGLQVAAAS